VVIKVWMVLALIWHCMVDQVTIHTPLMRNI